jgi:hypothetical protein
MAKKFLTNLDLAKNQILNVALQNLATAPTSPVTGQIYYNTADARVYFWDSAAWVDMSGDIQDVLGGAGLTASTSGNGDVITLDVNVDNATIEINADTLRIKDLGVTTAKLADSAVTTVKINANAVTFAKLQQLSTMTVIGNVTGSTANAAEVSVITDGTLATASNANIPTSTAVKTYVDAQIGALGNLEGAWDASTGSFPVGAAPVVGTKKGDYWYVSVAGTVNGVPFNVGDMLIALVNSASTTTYAANWTSLEVNRDQATTTVLGLVFIATQTEVNTGTDTVKAVTPATLAGRTATETRTGIAAIATQADTNTGTDDTEIVTPLKLKTNLATYKHSANVVVTTAGNYTVTHNLGTTDVMVRVSDTSNNELVVCDITITSTNVVTLAFSGSPIAGTYRVVVSSL